MLGDGAYEDTPCSVRIRNESNIYQERVKMIWLHMTLVVRIFD